jgi:hypothetical protein
MPGLRGFTQHVATLGAPATRNNVDVPDVSEADGAGFSSRLGEHNQKVVEGVRDPFEESKPGFEDARTVALQPSLGFEGGLDVLNADEARALGI